MTPEERRRADGLAAAALQLAMDMVQAEADGDEVGARRIRSELDRTCCEVVPYLIQYRDERNAWRERRLPQ